MVDISIPQKQLITLKNEDQGTQKKAPMGFHNQQEAKPSPNPQIDKQQTTGRMGRMNHCSVLPIPGP
jgi:hypothetical protein